MNNSCGLLGYRMVSSSRASGPGMISSGLYRPGSRDVALGWLVVYPKHAPGGVLCYLSELASPGVAVSPQPDTIFKMSNILMYRKEKNMIKSAQHRGAG